MREAEPHRGGGWWVQGEAYACNTATEHVNRHGERGPADRQPLIGIHHDEIHERMIHLKDLERCARLWCAARCRQEGLCRGGAFTPLPRHLGTDGTDPRADRI